MYTTTALKMPNDFKTRSVGVLNGSLGPFETKEVNSTQVWSEKDILIEEAWDEKKVLIFHLGTWGSNDFLNTQNSTKYRYCIRGTKCLFLPKNRFLIFNRDTYGKYSLSSSFKLKLNALLTRALLACDAFFHIKKAL